jgi:hypothetical protein
MANIIEENPITDSDSENEDLFFENPDLVETVSFEDLESNSFDLILFQRPNSEIVMNSVLSSNDQLVNLNTLYVSGCIDTGTYQSITYRQEKDIDYRQLFHPLNNVHCKKMKGEKLVGIRISRGEYQLIDLLTKHLKKNHFIILMYRGELELYWSYDRALSCLILNNEGKFQVIYYGSETSPLVTDLDDFLDKNDTLDIYHMFVLGIFGRKETKKNLQKSINLVSLRKSLPSCLSKDIYDFAQFE